MSDPKSDDQLNSLSNTANIDSNQDPNMEVHHHTHHAHDKRNWKSYFWEFLMLFLAVIKQAWAKRFVTPEEMENL